MKLAIFCVLLATLALMLVCPPGMAHTLFMNVTDNLDGTVTVEGLYSTGAMAVRTPVRLTTPEGEVVFEGTTDDFGQLEFSKPTTPYTIILDGGPGHKVEQQGP